MPQTLGNRLSQSLYGNSHIFYLVLFYLVIIFSSSVVWFQIDNIGGSWIHQPAVTNRENCLDNVSGGQLIPRKRVESHTAGTAPRRTMTCRQTVRVLNKLLFAPQAGSNPRRRMLQNTTSLSRMSRSVVKLDQNLPSSFYLKGRL